MSFEDFKPDLNLATPVSEQIEEEIKSQISRGELKPGDQLPVMRVMAKKLGCGLVSVNKAIQSLKTQEILVSQGNKGIFVADLDAELISSLSEETIYIKIKEVVEFAKQRSMAKQDFLDLVSEVFLED